MPIIEMARSSHGGTTWMGRLPYECDILTALQDFCIYHRIQTGWIQLIGAVKRAVISTYDQRAHEYHTRTLEGDYEIVSGSGNISMKEGKPFIHLHIVLSDPEFHCHGGHLMPGSSEVFACEFILWPFYGLQMLHREHDATTGLALWTH